MKYTYEYKTPNMMNKWVLCLSRLGCVLWLAFWLPLVYRVMTFSFKSDHPEDFVLFLFITVLVFGVALVLSGFFYGANLIVRISGTKLYFFCYAKGPKIGRGVLPYRKTIPITDVKDVRNILIVSKKTLSVSKDNEVGFADWIERRYHKVLSDFPLKSYYSNGCGRLKTNFADGTPVDYPNKYAADLELIDGRVFRLEFKEAEKFVDILRNRLFRASLLK